MESRAIRSGSRSITSAKCTGTGRWPGRLSWTSRSGSRRVVAQHRQAPIDRGMPMTHRLDPLLRPRSVAIVGASARPDSMGEWALKNLLLGGYRGTIYPINPGYDDLQGH